MNWATVAPETRLYKGKELFRWDVSPGLEHHCGTCSKPLHNARAKTSCIGKHVEPCYRFHQQLHFIGRSHECFGCNHSDEMHHNRHKEILVLVRKIATLDDLSQALQASSDSPVQGKSRRGSAFTISTATTPTEASSEYAEDVTKMKKSERKKAKEMGLDSAAKKRKVEVFSKEDTDFISEAIHLSIHETKGGWEGTYVYVNKQPDAEQSIPEVDELEDIVDMTSALSVKVPNDMTPRQRKCVKKFSTPVKHAGYRGGSRRFSPTGGHANDIFDGLDPQIFFRLGLEVVNPVKNSVARKELVAKLITVVKNDLSIITQEDEETVMRQEGFLRWAGKAAYAAIQRTREGLDWATGQKIGNPHIPRKEPAGYDQTFVGGVMDTDIHNLDNAMKASGQTINTMADDDPPKIKENGDFSVKAPVMVVAKKRVEDSEEGWETPAARHTTRKRRTEGGRVFRTEGMGGVMATLRIVA